MSSALSWYYNNMLIGTGMSCLSKYQVITSGLLCIVAKFYMNIMPPRPSEIRMIEFPRIGNGTLAHTHTAEGLTNTSTNQEGGNLGRRTKHINYSTNLLPWYDVHTHTPVVYVIRH